MKKITILLVGLFLIGLSLSLIAQTPAERAQFLKDYKSAISIKTDMIKADPALYQKALESGWFHQMEVGLKNAEDFANGTIGSNGAGPLSPESSNGLCANATPFCTQNGDTYPAGVNTGNAESGPSYGCLGSQPNPAWFYMKILTGGDLHITETNSNNIDVDFILWGPFGGPTCGTSLSAGTIVDCSFSSGATEFIDIASCTSGQYYMLLVTNYSNNATNITLAKTSGSATTDCAITLVPLPPTANAASGITGNSFTANWTPASGDPHPATSFVLDVSTDPNFGSFVPGYQDLNVGSGTSFQVTGLSSCVPYYYRLRGVNTSGESNNSNVIGPVTTSCCTNPTYAGSIAADQTHCDSFTPAAFTSTAAPTGYTGNLEYKWQYSLSPFSTWTDIPSSNSSTYAPGLLTMTTKYQRLARVDCMPDWSGAAVSNVLTVTINPLPAQFNVTGGGAYCAGGIGVAVGLSGSVSGINYALYNGASLVTTLTGTGSSLNYGLQLASGTYTVVATNISTDCVNNMTGSATVIINPLPTPVITGPTSVAMGTTATYTTPLVSGHTYSWTVIFGTFVSCGANCITVHWPFYCNIQDPGRVIVTETNTATGCVQTVTLLVTINN